MDLRMVSWDDNGYVFFGARLFSLHFHGSEVIAFLLTSFVKPKREKASSLSLLFARCAAQIKQNVGIRAKECFNNAKNGLPNFRIVR